MLNTTIADKLLIIAYGDLDLVQRSIRVVVGEDGRSDLEKVVEFIIEHRESMIQHYRGMNYERSSREAARLIARAAETGSWFDLPEKLAQLRENMQHQMARAVHGTNLNFAHGG